MKTVTTEVDLRATASKIDAELSAVGQAIEKLDRSAVRTPDLSACLDRLTASKRAVDEAAGEIGRIKKCLEVVQERERQAQDCERRRKESADERSRTLAELGAGSWTVYREMADGARYRPLFEDVIRLEAESEGISRDIQSLKETGGSGLIGRLKTLGSRISKRGTLSRVERQRLEALAATGSKLAASDFARHTNGSLRLLYDFVEQKNRIIEQLETERAGHQAEIAKQREALAALGASERPQQRLGELGDRIRKSEADVRETHVAAGRIFIDRDLRAELADSALSTRFEIVAGLRMEAGRIRAAADRRRAEEEIDELGRRAGKLRSRRGSIEEERREKDRQVADIDAELSRDERRLEVLRKVVAGEVPFPDKEPGARSQNPG